jgi:hypothetical protein
LDDVVLLVAVYVDAAGDRERALEILASRETARNRFYRGD